MTSPSFAQHANLIEKWIVTFASQTDGLNQLNCAIFLQLILTTIGCLRNSCRAASRRLVRFTPWKDCWYLAENGRKRNHSDESLAVRMLLKHTRLQETPPNVTLKMISFNKLNANLSVLTEETIIVSKESVDPCLIRLLSQQHQAVKGNALTLERIFYLV